MDSSNPIPFARTWALLALGAPLTLGACGGSDVPETPSTSSAFLSGAEDAEYEDGMRDKLAGDLVAAEAHFRAALVANPRYLAAHLALGDVLLERGRFAESRDAYRDAVQLRSSSVDAHLGEGRATLALGEFADAIGPASQSVALAENVNSPELHAEARTLLARAHEGAGHTDEAIAEYEAALRVLATSTDARTRLARLYAARERVSDAVSLLRRGEPYLATAEDYAVVAGAYYELGVHESAVPLLQTARELEPSNDDVLFYFAASSVRVGEAEAGIDAASELLSRNPGYLDAYVVRAEGRWRRGFTESARTDLETVFAQAPDHFAGTLLLADIEASEGNDDAAGEHFARALQLRPGDGFATARSAEFYTDRRRYDDVVAVLSPVIERADRPARWLLLYSGALIQLGSESDAVPYQSAYAATRRQDHALNREVAERALAHPGSLDAAAILNHARLAIEYVGGAPLPYRLTLFDALLHAGEVGEARDVLDLASDAFPGAVELRERRSRL